MSLNIGHEPHEPFVLMILMVAVGQPWTGAQAQDGPRRHAIVTEGVDRLSERKLEPQRRNPQRIVGGARDLGIGSAQACTHGHAGRAGTEQETAAVDQGRRVERCAPSPLVHRPVIRNREDGFCDSINEPAEFEITMRRSAWVG
jgi:hypothetical protein